MAGGPLLPSSIYMGGAAGSLSASVDIPSVNTAGGGAMDGVGVQAHREARSQRRKGRLGRVRSRIVAEQCWRLIDNVWRQIANIVEVPETPLGNCLAFERLNGFRVRLPAFDQLFKAAFIDRR